MSVFLSRGGRGASLTLPTGAFGEQDPRTGHPAGRPHALPAREAITPSVSTGCPVPSSQRGPW